MLGLLLIASFAFADDHAPYVSCPVTNVIYDGLKACPGNCVEVTKDIENLRAMKCHGGKLVVDAQKSKSIDDADKAEKKKKRDKEDRVKRIEQGCANAEGLIKELCDQILDK